MFSRLREQASVQASQLKDRLHNQGNGEGYAQDKETSSEQNVGEETSEKVQIKSEGDGWKPPVSTESSMFSLFRSKQQLVPKDTSTANEESTADALTLEVDCSDLASEEEQTIRNSGRQKERNADPDAFAVVSGMFGGFSQKEEVDPDILLDPETIRLNHQLEVAHKELNQLKRQSRAATKRRNAELSQLSRYKSSKGRELWLTQQRHRHFGLNEYRDCLLSLSLSEHDTSQHTLNAEAKLLRAQHADSIVDHQLKITNAHLQGLIDYMYTVAMPEIREEHGLAKLVGQAQVRKARVSKDKMVSLFEDYLRIQRKVIAKYKLRELEQQQHAPKRKCEALSTSLATKEELELTKMAAGDIPAMERDPELRDSAKQRLEERKQRLEDRKARRKVHDTEFNTAIENISQVEKDALEKASKHLESLSSHSLDLSLDASVNRSDLLATTSNKDIKDDTDEILEKDGMAFGSLFDAKDFDGSRSAWKGSQDVPAALTVEEEVSISAASKDLKSGEKVSSVSQQPDCTTNTPLPPPPGEEHPPSDARSPRSIVHPSSANVSLARLRARREARSQRDEELSLSRSSLGSPGVSRSSRKTTGETLSPRQLERTKLQESFHNESQSRVLSEKKNDDGSLSDKVESVDNDEPISPKKRLSLEDHQGLRRGERGSRSELLSRARSARLNNTSSNKNTRVRPSLGSRAISSRDVGRRATRPTIRHGLSVSDHNATRTSTDADREARLERLASRRRLGVGNRGLSSRRVTSTDNNIVEGGGAADHKVEFEGESSAAEHEATTGAGTALDQALELRTQASAESN